MATRNDGLAEVLVQLAANSAQLIEKARASGLFRQPETVDVKASPAPEPAAAAGVCHADLRFMEGSDPYPLPAVLGHESAGVVEQVGSEVRTVKPGDHVITCLSAFCGHCDQCLTGHLSLCSSTEMSRGPDD